MQHKHHHHVGALTLIPIALFLIAPQWGKASMAPTIKEYAKYANQAEQKMELLDTLFADLQRTHSLITHGEENVIYPSVIVQHQQENLPSSLERIYMANIRNDTLKERIAAFRGRIRDLTNSQQMVYIDLSEQQTRLIQDGVIIARYPISSGAYETPTPKGRFQVYRKQELRVSNQEVPYRMPYYISFTKNQAYGLHALPYLGNKANNSDYWYEALDHIGTPVSHGCVRFLPEDIIVLYDWIEMGTPVWIGA